MDEYLKKHWSKDANFTLSEEQITLYDKKMKECCEILVQAWKDHVSGNHEGWVKNVEERQADGTIITLHQKPDDAGLSYTKITSTVHIPASDALHWSTDISNSAKYDEYYDQSEFFVDLSDKIAPHGFHDKLRGFALARSQIKGYGFILKPREFVHLIGKEELPNEYGNIGIAPMTSVPCESILERDTHVRGFLDNQGSVFIPNEDGTCTVINITHINMNGWIPDWVMNLITNDISQTKRMRDVIHSEFNIKK